MSIDSIISTAWTVFKSHLAAPIGQQFRYVIFYKSYRKDLENQVGKLEYKLLWVQDKVAQARNNNKSIYKMVNKWQESAEKTVKEAREHLESEGKANKDTCCYGKLPNPKTRFVFSRMAKKMMGVIEQLVIECNEIKEIYYEGPPPGIVAADLTTHIDSTTLAPGRGGTVDAATLAMPSASDDDVYESRDEVVRHVMRALANESTNVVGVHGPGGVGKSTLLEEVERQIRKRRLFDVVAKADVSENPDIMGIQERIADYLGLRDINQSQDKHVRARKMHERLLQKDGNSKILIILDNLWKRLDLKEVGIPCGHDNKVVGCKLLLTSRSRDVLLKDMCSDEEFLLSELKEEEAQRLFRKIVGTKVDDREIKPLVDEVLKKCAGLPLLIVSIGKNLKHDSASTWRDFLRRIMVSNDRVTDVIYTTIERSYDHLGTDELKDLFIACAIAGHSTIYSRDLLIYSMGLDLFGRVLRMEDARDTMKTLLHSLQASCLLQGSTDNNVKIHDLVREVAILIAKKRDKLVVVMGNDLKDWSADMLKSCYAISLPLVDIQELPEGLECPKLKFFFLESKNHYIAVPDSFFKSMGELKVLDLTLLHLTSLPSSIQFLENLQTLCLDCCFLNDVTILGKLRRLQVLSFIGSALGRLPKEVGELTELRLLDLSHCSRLATIDPGTLGNLVQLEELYMENSFDRWEAEDKVAAQSNACLIELNNMTKLSTLDISILDANVLPKDLPFGKLNKYRIHIGDVWDWSSEYKESRTLKLKLGSSSTLSREWVQVTLQKTQVLHLHGLEGNKKSVQKLCREGFQELKYLHARDSPLIQYIVQSSEWQQSTAFMFLEEMIIEGLINLEKICSGHLTKGSLSNLRVVKMERCDKLKNVFLHSLVRGLSQLEEIEVRNCKSMQEIISDAGTEDEEEEEERGGVGTVELQKLRRVTLESLPEIISFCTKTERASEIAAENELGATCAFFDEQQVSFPFLEHLTLSDLPKAKEIWHDEPTLELFNNLLSLRVHNCSFPSSGIKWNLLLKLPNLESLTVTSCQDVQKVFDLQKLRSSQNIGEVLPRLTTFHLSDLPSLRCIWDENPRGTSSFQNLKFLKVQSCHNMRFLFSSSMVKAVSQIRRIEVANCTMMQEIILQEEGEEAIEDIVFPQLTFLSLKELPNLTSISGALFDEKVTFPNIEELRIEGIALNELWHNEVPAESFSKLKLLEVKRCAQLLCVVPSFMLRRLHCLESLTVEDCSTMEFIYELKGQNFMASKPVRANRLTNLSLRKLPKLRHICEGDISGALCFRNLKTLGVYDCRGVKYIMSRSMASDLCQLQKIKIKDCDALEEVFIIEREEDDENEEPRFPMLDSVVLDSLPNLADFCSGNGVLECRILKTISVANCPKMDTFMSPLRKKQMLEIVDESGEEILGKGEIQVPATAFFSEKVHFPSLETLVISHVNSFEMIWDDHLPRDTFNKLKLIRVKFCEKLLNIFPFASLGQFRSLETLHATDCNSLEGIFKFPLLNSFAKNAAVGIPLKMLNLQDPQGTVTFQNLREIEVRRCQRLTNVFSASVAQGLTKLEKLWISESEMIAELIFAASDSLEDGGDPTASSIFPQLTSLKLYDLPQLKSLFRHWHTPEWPLLKELSVCHCDKFTVFSESCGTNTENQLGISHQQALFSAEKVIPNLKLLALDSRDVRTIRDGKFREDILSNLATLILECFHDENAVFPLSFLIQRFGKLEKLVVRCCSFKEIFSDDMSGQDGTIISEGLAGEGKPIMAFGSLRFLQLHNLHNLKHIWKEDSLAAEILKKIRCLYMEQCNSLTVLFPASATLKNLTVLEVEDCLGLKHLMMSSVAKSLVQLKKMSITKCNAIEEVVSDEGNRAGEEVRFLKLQYLELGCLDNLVSFSSMQCSFVFPCLEVVIVRQCPKMNIFSEGVCRTPKLDKVRASEEDEEGRWDGDLNTTIQKLSS